MQQRWRAIYYEDGEKREFVFDSLNKPGIARIDFLLKANLAGIRIPEHFELEETDQEERVAWLLQ